jgi:hypothetical protein
VSECGGTCTVSECGGTCTVSECGGTCTVSDYGSTRTVSDYGDIRTVSDCGGVCTASDCGNEGLRLEVGGLILRAGSRAIAQAQVSSAASMAVVSLPDAYLAAHGTLKAQLLHRAHGKPFGLLLFGAPWAEASAALLLPGCFLSAGC